MDGDKLPEDSKEPISQETNIPKLPVVKVLYVCADNNGNLLSHPNGALFLSDSIEGAKKVFKLLSPSVKMGGLELKIFSYNLDKDETEKCRSVIVNV